MATYICSRKKAGECSNPGCAFGKPRRMRDSLGPLRCTMAMPMVPGGVVVDEAEVDQAPKHDARKAGAA
jgi:hypothetical protein